jgi:hypothetical protein
MRIGDKEGNDLSSAAPHTGSGSGSRDVLIITPRKRKKTCKSPVKKKV